MKNIIDEKPTNELHGRTLYATQFVSDVDIKGKRILDIGCGLGWCELNFLKRGADKIVGIELTNRDLEIARKNILNNRVAFKVANAIKLPFKNEMFNTVVCWEVIEHLPKNTEDELFSEVNRVLKKDGIFYLSTPFSCFVSNILDPAWWIIKHRHYYKNQLIKYAKDNSFEVLDIKIKGRLWSLFSILNMYFSKWIFRRKSIFQDYFIRKENFEYKKDNGFVNIFIKYKKI